MDDRDTKGGLKNRYFLGKRMKPRAFEVEQAYHVERRRQINRAVHGRGVAQGFSVKPSTPAGKLVISPGIAFDEHGRELVQLEPFELTAKHVWISEKLREQAMTGNLLCQLSAHYAERPEDRVKVCESCGCPRDEWEYRRETVGYSLRVIERQTCDAAQKLDGRFCAEPGDCNRAPVLGDRGPHHCLAEHASSEWPTAAPCDMEEQSSGLLVDRGQGVGLACVALEWDAACAELRFGPDVTCSHLRPLVKSNPLLYDLIRGRDLTRIEKISWHDWHRKDAPVPFVSFADRLQGRGQDGFWLKFSGPVQRDTVTPDCFLITATFVDDNTGWGKCMRLPLAGAKYDDTDHTVHLVPDGDWVRDEIISVRSGFKSDSLLEIEVRGDFILDCHGQAIDANARGKAVPPTGNGTPGGTFLSAFRVAKR